jgi:pyruvate,water dikinase
LPGARPSPVDVPDAERRLFSITDAEAEELARFAVVIERHYQRPMDIEWGRDGNDGQLYILQARPETVKSRESGDNLRRYRLGATAEVLATGRAIGQKIGQGAVRLIRSAAEMERVGAGDVLVTDMTDPDWEPVMKRASAIVTNRGGRTCHAAIIARELGIPAVVGCGDATKVLHEGAAVTVSCADGDTGHVYAGLLPIEVIDVALDRMPPCPTKIMMNVGNPELAFGFQRLPERRRRPRAPRVHHQPQRGHPSEGAPGAGAATGGPAAGDRAARRRVRESRRVLHRQGCRGRGDDRRRVLAEEGHRAAVGLQVQ